MLPSQECRHSYFIRSVESGVMYSAAVSTYLILGAIPSASIVQEPVMEMLTQLVVYLSTSTMSALSQCSLFTGYRADLDNRPGRLGGQCAERRSQCEDGDDLERQLTAQTPHFRDNPTLASEHSRQGPVHSV
jgi:hypothetical protein